MPAEGPEVIPTDAEKAAEIPIAAADSVITDISSVSVAEDVSQPVAADPDDEAIRTEQSETIPQPDVTRLPKYQIQQKSWKAQFCPNLHYQKIRPTMKIKALKALRTSLQNQPKSRPKQMQ